MNNNKENQNMKATEIITTFLRHDGRYYANINGITNGSIGCYFDAEGNLVANTLDRGSRYQQLIEKLHAEILRRGVFIPQVEQ